MANAKVLYRVSDGKILGGAFGEVREPAYGEAVLEWHEIPDPELYSVVGGEPVRRADGDVEAERERELLVTRQRELALDSLLLKEARALGLAELEEKLLNQPAP